MTEVWKTASEWAGASVNELPSTKAGLIARATRESWPRRKRSGRGGGWEYPLSALPESARLDYATRMVAKAVGTLPADTVIPRKAPSSTRATRPVKPMTQLAPAALAVAEARLAVLRAWWGFKDAAGLVDSKARPAFVAAWRAGQITVKDSVKDTVKGLSRATLYNWEAAFKNAGLSGLAPTYGNRAGSGVMDSDQDLKDFVLGLLVQAPHTSSATLMSGLRARFADRQLPHYRTVAKWLAKWKADNAQLFLKVINPDAWRSKYKSASGSQSANILRLNHVWELDSTPADLLLADTHTPPNGWHCRCTVESLTERDLTRYGYTPSAGPPYSGPDKQWKNPATGEIIAVPAGIDPGWAYNPGQAAAPISGAVTKLDRLPAAAGARGTDLIAPIAENYQAMVIKIGDGLDQGRVKNTGERLPVGIMSPKVVQALTAIGETPSAAGLWITDKNLTHMMRDAKTAAKTKAGLPKGLLLDDLLRLPQVLATPESVYWDKDTRSVLYVFSSESRPGSKGKYAVRVNWQDRGTKQPTNTILTGGWEDTFPAARYIRLDD